VTLVEPDFARRVDAPIEKGAEIDVALAMRSIAGEAAEQVQRDEAGPRFVRQPGGQRVDERGSIARTVHGGLDRVDSSTRRLVHRRAEDACRPDELAARARPVSSAAW
jgi:hypothetical protein